MKRIFVPTQGPEDWKRLLADPDLHSVDGRSAKCLAEPWEQAAPGFPRSVEDALKSSGVPDLQELEILAAFPEYQVPLPGGSTASQTDLMVIARGAAGLVVIAVEGKVDETFGPTVGEKREGASAGQTERLTYLHQVLQLSQPVPGSIRYQLLHRTASALIVAEQYSAVAAVMLVHSFSAERAGFEEFASFSNLMGAEVAIGEIARARVNQRLYLGWVR